MKQRNKAVPAAYIILEKDGQILIGRRANTSYQDGNYQMPAGHVEASEAPTAAAVREAKEEIGVDINPSDFELVHTMHRPAHDATGDRIDLFFRTRVWKGKVENKEPLKCEDLHWASYNELPVNMVPHVKHALECIAQGKAYSELNTEFLKKAGVYSL